MKDASRYRRCLYCSELLLIEVFYENALKKSMRFRRHEQCLTLRDASSGYSSEYKSLRCVLCRIPSSSTNTLLTFLEIACSKVRLILYLGFWAV